MNLEYFIAKRLITAKHFKSSISAPIIKIAISAIAIGMIMMIVSVATNAESKNYVDDNIYYGLSIYYANLKKDVVIDKPALLKADGAFEKVAKASPTYQDAYLYRARTNALLENNEVMKRNYEDFIAKATEKGPEELVKPLVKKKFIESYNNIASTYLTSDKANAKEYVNKSRCIYQLHYYHI